MGGCKNGRVLASSNVMYVGVNLRQTPIMDGKHSGNVTYWEESLLLFGHKSRRNSN